MSTLTIGPAFRPVHQPAVRRSTVRLTRRGRDHDADREREDQGRQEHHDAAGSVATGEAGTPEPTKVITVGSGDTLWQIAADLADDGEVRAMMEKIERLNALDSGMLSAGQRLVVPAP